MDGSGISRFTVTVSRVTGTRVTLSGVVVASVTPDELSLELASVELSEFVEALVVSREALLLVTESDMSL